MILTMNGRLDEGRADGSADRSTTPEHIRAFLIARGQLSSDVLLHARYAELIALEDSDLRAAAVEAKEALDNLTRICQRRFYKSGAHPEGHAWTLPT